MSLTVILANGFDPAGGDTEDGAAPDYSVDVVLSKKPPRPRLADWAALDALATSFSLVGLTPAVVGALSIVDILGVSRTRLVSADLRLRTATGEITFGYDSIGDRDVVTIAQVTPGRFLASVAHDTVRIGCRARCADGTEGQPCVECEVNGIVIRVCC